MLHGNHIFYYIFVLLFEHVYTFEKNQNKKTHQI